MVISINPHRFTSAVLLYMVSGVHSIGSLCTIPALFTRPHSLPKNYIFKSCHPSNSVAKTECPEWKGMVQFPSPILFYFGPQCAMLQTFVPITIPVPCFKYTLITSRHFTSSRKTANSEQVFRRIASRGKNYSVYSFHLDLSGGLRGTFC